MVTANDLLEQAILHGAIKDRARTEAAALKTQQAPQITQQPQIVYLPTQTRSGGAWIGKFLIGGLIVGAFVFGKFGVPISITPATQPQAQVGGVTAPTSRPAPGAPVTTTWTRPTTVPVAPVQSQAQEQPQAAPVIVGKAQPAMDIPTVAPSVEHIPDVGESANAQPTEEAAPPQYQYDPSKPNGLEAKNTGEYEGWGGGGGSGWFIPAAKPVAHVSDVQPTAKPKPTEQPAQASTDGWGGGGGSGWEIPAANTDTNGWSVGN